MTLVQGEGWVSSMSWGGWNSEACANGLCIYCDALGAMGSELQLLCN